MAYPHTVEDGLDPLEVLLQSGVLQRAQFGRCGIERLRYTRRGGAREFRSILALIEIGRQIVELAEAAFGLDLGPEP